METIEQYTSEGTGTGIAMDRNDAHANAIPHSTVHIWIVNNNEILLQKRAETKESHPGKWDVSAAGHIPFGESPLNAALRECEEELGLVLDSSELEKKAFFFQKYDNDETNFHDREWVHLFLVKKEVSIQECTVQVEEVSEVKWFSLSDFSDLVSNHSPTLVSHWNEYQKLIEILS